MWPFHPGRVVKEPERQPHIHWTTCYDFEEMRKKRAVLLHKSKEKKHTKKGTQKMNTKKEPNLKKKNQKKDPKKKEQKKKKK